MKPFLKWAGGKTQLLPELMKYVPEQYERYIDPFVGGGALFFELQPNRAIIADANEHLIETYQAIRDDVCSVIEILDIIKPIDSKDFYYFHREMEFPPIFIYKNKACFNGLYRVNKQGRFNVPYGNYKNIQLYDATNLQNVSNYLKEFNENHCVAIAHLDYTETLRMADKLHKPGDFVYCDPPYHGGFTAYTAQGFTEQDQADLARICADLAVKGSHILASNSNTDFIRQTWGQYGCFDIHEVEAPRSINCKGNGRRKVKELIITNVRKT
ncbi:MAG: DNA adenine methylase [Magnetococcales bacterium]|nr:DNA adenine methylase [Nitrospirota bacterium]